MEEKKDLPFFKIREQRRSERLEDDSLFSESIKKGIKL